MTATKKTIAEAILDDEITPQQLLDKACNVLLPGLAVMQAISRNKNHLDSAARWLSISEKSVGYVHNCLKEELGTRLLESGKVNNRSMTALGKRYVALADEILPILERFLDEYRTARTVPKVNIATINSAWFAYSTKMKSHCGPIELQAVHQRTPQAVRDQVASRSCDIGIVSYDVVVKPPLYRQIWIQEDMVLAANKSWKPYLKDGKVTHKRMAESKVLLFVPGLKIAEVIEQYLYTEIQMPANQLQPIGAEIQSIIRAIENGDGISILPLPTVQNNANIATYDLPVPMDPRPLSIICHRDSLENPYVRKTLEFFGKVLDRFDKEVERTRTARKRAKA
jgi:DNA-binding transcriptional LysR family regulator